LRVGTCACCGDKLRERGEFARAWTYLKSAHTVLLRSLEQTGHKAASLRVAQLELTFGHTCADEGNANAARVWYERARARYLAISEQDGECEFSLELSGLDTHIAGAYLTPGDITNALPRFANARALLARLVQQEGRRELTANMAMADSNYGNALRLSGDLTGAEGPLRRAVDTLSRLVEQDGRNDVQSQLAHGFSTLAMCMRDQRDFPSAVQSLQQARAIMTEIAAIPGRRTAVPEQSRIEVNLGYLAKLQGDEAGAREHFLFARQILRKAVEEDGRRDLTTTLAWTEHSLGESLYALCDLEEAIAAFQRGARLVSNLGETDQQANAPLLLKHVLGIGDVEAAQALRSEQKGELVAALEAWERARDAYAYLAGRGTVKHVLSVVAMENNIGKTLNALGQPAQAVEGLERATSSCAWLLEQQHGERAQVIEYFGLVSLTLGQALMGKGESERALAALTHARELCGPLVENQGRRDLTLALSNIDWCLGRVLRGRGDLPGAIAVLERALAGRRGRAPASQVEHCAEDLA
jgi:tetratricopeptide (TPR) repeat protein